MKARVMFNGKEYTRDNKADEWAFLVPFYNNSDIGVLGNENMRVVVAPTGFTVYETDGKSGKYVNAVKVGNRCGIETYTFGKGYSMAVEYNDGAYPFKEIKGVTMITPDKDFWSCVY